MQKTTQIVLLAIAMALAFSAHGQGFYSKSRYRNFLLGAGTGTTHYYGDLAKPGDHSNIKPNFHLSARYNFYRNLSASTEVTWFMFSGTDSKDPIKAPRNLSFRSHNVEWNMLLRLSLLEINRYYLRSFANPYIYAGLGLVNFNPSANLDGEWHRLRPLRTEARDYGSFALSFPMGVGVNFKVNAFFDIGLEGGYRFTTSDYLDDVSSGIYPDPASFSSDIARRLSDRSGELGANPTFAEQDRMVRGDPSQKDGFFILNIKAEWYFAQIGKGRTYGSLFNPRRIKPYKIQKRGSPKSLRRR